jgi:hypothetical protein
MGKLFFVELGPKFSFLMSAKESGDFAGTSVSEFDVKEGYKKTIVSAALGLGVRIPVAPKIHVNAGLRLAYGLTDATKEYSSQTELNAKGDQISLGTNAAHFSQQGDFSYKSTHLATGYIMVGATYQL